MASVPQHQPELFPETNLIDSIGYGFNRAKLAWYSIDPIFLRNNSQTPDYIKNNPDLQSSHFVREVFEKEIFPYKDPHPPIKIPQIITVLNLSFYPTEKGPYNYEVSPTTFSDGIDSNGYLNNPASRWAGISRYIIYPTELDTVKIKNIEFWLMDPFVYDTVDMDGELYINTGEISEDILKDSRMLFESGLPASVEVKNVDTTIWGRVPLTQSLVPAFDNSESARPFQDVGFDGLRNEDEILFFSKGNGLHPYLDSIAAKFGTQSIAYQNALTDPSNDNFHYYRGTDYDQQQLGILDRYKNFNNPDGNSPSSNQSNENYQTSGTIQPDIEDFNRDKILNESENYFQYKVYINPDSFKIGQNFIDSIFSYNAYLKNGTISWVTWYHFTIPLCRFQNKFGNIDDCYRFNNIRIFLKGFKKNMILRFATLDLTSDTSGMYIKPENALTNQVYVYPNPNNGNFSIYFDSNKIIWKVELYDLQGNKLQLKNFGQSREKMKNVKLLNLPKGIYLAKIYFNAYSYETKKIIIL